MSVQDATKPLHANIRELEDTISEMQSKLAAEARRHKDELYRRLTAERQSHTKDKNRYAADKVTEALIKRNKEFDAEIEQRVAERVAVVQARLEATLAPHLVLQREELIAKARKIECNDTPARVETMKCAICADNESRVCFIPCGHVAACCTCARHYLTKRSTYCHMCAVEVVDIVKVFI